MKKRLFGIVFMVAVTIGAFAQKIDNLKTVAIHKTHGGEGWCYLSIDEKSSNIFISLGNELEILSSKGDSIGVIKKTQGIHGIFIAREFGKGRTTNGRSGSCTVFDLNNFTL